MKMYTKMLTTAILVAMTASVYAEEKQNDIFTRPNLTGSWWGVRDKLADHGITFGLNYINEAARNNTGGTDHLSKYADQWFAGVTFGLDKLVGWKGGTFQVSYTYRDGKDVGLQANIGNNQSFQEIFGGGQTFLLTQFWFMQSLFDDRINWKIGRLGIDEDFDSFGTSFQNLTFNGSPPGNILGYYWMNSPISVWGTRIKVKPTDNTYVQTGVYQVSPNYSNLDWQKNDGDKLDIPDNTTGALIPIEFGWTPKIFKGLPGTYKFGAWIDNSGGNDLFLDQNFQPMAITGDTALHRFARYGGYFSFMQQVTGTDGGAGLQVFFNLTVGDHNTSVTDRQMALGMVYNGPFGRANDIMGLAFGETHSNHRQANYQRLYNYLNPDDQSVVNANSEYVTELFYSWSPIKSITLSPNIQYNLHPGGSTKNKNAFVMGLRSTVTF